MSQGATEQGQDPGNGGAGAQGQDPGANPGQQGQDPNAGQQDPANGPTFDLDKITDPDTRAYVEAQQKAAKEARDQAARYRTERNTHQQTLEQLQRASETAEQAAAREAAEAAERQKAETDRLGKLEQENRDLKVTFAVTAAATDARAYNPERVAGMVASKVELDAEGKPNAESVTKALADLKVSDPYLFRKAKNDAGAGGGAGGEGDAPATSMNDNIRNMLGARRGRPTTD